MNWFWFTSNVQFTTLVLFLFSEGMIWASLNMFVRRIKIANSTYWKSWLYCYPIFPDFTRNKVNAKTSRFTKKKKEKKYNTHQQPYVCLRPLVGVTPYDGGVNDNEALWTIFFSSARGHQKSDTCHTHCAHTHEFPWSLNRMVSRSFSL